MRAASLAFLLCLPAAAADLSVDFAPTPGAPLALSARLRDESGRTARLGDYFGRGRPVIVALVYYECPMLCTLTLNGLLRGLGLLSWTAGRDFDVVAVSISPSESFRLAAEKKRRLLESYQRPGAYGGWHLLTGAQDQVAAVAASAGFKYRFEPSTGQYYHASGILVATPDGRVSRALFGAEYQAEDLRLALLDASRDRVAAKLERALLYCWRYDPALGRYSLDVLRLLRAAAVLTAVCLAAYVLALRRGEAA